MACKNSDVAHVAHQGKRGHLTKTAIMNFRRWRFSTNTNSIVHSRKPLVQSVSHMDAYQTVSGFAIESTSCFSDFAQPVVCGDSQSLIWSFSWCCDVWLRMWSLCRHRTCPSTSLTDNRAYVIQHISVYDIYPGFSSSSPDCHFEIPAKVIQRSVERVLRDCYILCFAPATPCLWCPATHFMRVLGLRHISGSDGGCLMCYLVV